jgi:hypothetical protein
MEEPSLAQAREGNLQVAKTHLSSLSAERSSDSQKASEDSDEILVS